LHILCHPELVSGSMDLYTSTKILCIMKIYVVYILANNPLGTIYIGVTNNLKQRINEHKLGLIDGFTKKYGLKKLVYVEQFRYINKDC